MTVVLAVSQTFDSVLLGSRNALLVTDISYLDCPTGYHGPKVHVSVDTTLNIRGVYDPLYSAICPMNYLESDAMWYKYVIPRLLHNLIGCSVQECENM